MGTGARRGGGWRGLPARLRGQRPALAVLLAAPVPLALALLLTARPDYPDDACYYGAPQASLDATDDYLALLTPLAMFALALVAAVGLPMRGRWRLVAPALLVWAIASVGSPDTARPVMVAGAYLALFGLFLAVPVLVVVAVVGREGSWVRAIAWFELLFLLPLLLGLGGLLAQPKCFAGDPPAPIER